MPDPFTLKIFVPSGDAEGVRIIDRMNWTGKGYVVPRDRWSEVKGRPDVSCPGVYVLTGYESDELSGDRLVAYIGQTDNVRGRIESHDLKKDWWTQVVMFTSGGEGLNRAHTTWLEWELLRRAEDAKKCRLDNRAAPSEPSLTESEKADTRGFLNEMLRILPVMGVTLFEKAKEASAAELAAAGLAPSPQELRDTIVVPAQEEGFNEVFLGKNAWWAIRIAEKYKPNLRWIAGYVTRPTSAVTHYAEIDHFEPYGDKGKWKVAFKGPAKKLMQPIPFGDAPSGAIQGPRYTRRSLLDTARTVGELLQ